MLSWSYFRGARRPLFAALVVALALSALGAAYLVSVGGVRPFAFAQSDQPPETEELFQPFWEAWDLLHTNYVDPLDDVSLASGAVEGLLGAAETLGLDVSAIEAPTPPADCTGEACFAPMWDVWRTLHDRYADRLDADADNALMEGALRGMVASIGDPHTEYMDPETFARVNESMSGEYEGIGATVRQDEETGGLELVSIFEGSPAEEAGLRPGDQIVQVEGRDVTHMTQDEIIALVRGPAGTPVRLGILRPGVDEILKFEVVRARISVPSVRGELLETGIGYVRLAQFEFNTDAQLREVLQELDVNSLDGLILDVRGDPGGYLTTAIQVASEFIPEGVILIERSPEEEIVHEALGNPTAPDVPMVVLVDQGSASASELIAGAFQDHGRATVLGMPTFGKGSVQTWRTLSNGGGIRITISRWYTPNGRSVSEVGIQPDIVVPYDPEQTYDDERLDNQIVAAIQVLKGTYEPQPTPQASATP